MRFSSLYACLMSYPFHFLDCNIQIILVMSTYYEAPHYADFIAISYFHSTLFSSILNACSSLRMKNPSFTPCCFSVSCENTLKLLSKLMITLCYIRTQCTVNSWLSSIKHLSIQNSHATRKIFQTKFIILIKLCQKQNCNSHVFTHYSGG
jgi:hypothetical protein